MKTGTFYEINVSRNGKHLFATDSTIRSYTADEIAELLDLFDKQFPHQDGFQINVTSWNTTASPLPDNIKRALWIRTVPENRREYPQLKPDKIIQK